MSETARSLNCCGGKTLLSGSVAGIEACQLLSDNDEILVGSDIACDLAVPDPLIPDRAFRLRHIKKHTGVKKECNSHWLIEVLSGARVYVNRDLAKHERIVFGDVISTGCHQFLFRRAEAATRSRRTNINVYDLCSRLTAGWPIPAAFMDTCPSRIDRRRTRTAIKWGLLMVLFLAAVVVINPHSKIIQPVQPPMEVVMVSEISRAPAPTSVKSLDDVERKSFDLAHDPAKPAELATREPPVIEEMELAMVRDRSTAMKQPARPAKIEDLSDHTLQALVPLSVPTSERGRLRVDHSPERLARSVPQRRLTLAEASNPIFRRELSRLNIKVQNDLPELTAFRSSSRNLSEELKRPTQKQIRFDRNVRLSMLAEYKPTPLRFETYRGASIPVASIPRILSKIDISSNSDEKGIEFDGHVSKEEIAVSWKSGQFHLYGPNPQKAYPPTYCYVGKTTKDGKECLYISFICEDPNTDAIIANYNNSGGPVAVSRDDSIEIFLDTDFNRRDYYHVIVNARGKYHTAYCPTWQDGINDRIKHWNASSQVKTVINKQAKRWTCEILIPFHQLGGIPKKGSRWAVNFTRAFRGQARTDSVLQNWFLAYRSNDTGYHNPDLFGVFQW